MRKVGLGKAKEGIPVPTLGPFPSSDKIFREAEVYFLCFFKMFIYFERE